MREAFVLTLDATGKFNARLEKELLPVNAGSPGLLRRAQAMRGGGKPASAGLLRRAVGLLERASRTGASDVSPTRQLPPEVLPDMPDLGEPENLFTAEPFGDVGLGLPEAPPAEAAALSAPAGAAGPDASAAGPDADHAEDQAEIIRHIEDVVAANKIRVTHDTFTLHAKRSGTRLPVIVNLGALLLVVLGIGAMYLVFNQGQRVQARQTVQLKPAEGKLIEEIKKQNEASLAAKQQEIANIQAQLGDIARQRDSLATDMNAKVDARAAELKKEMDAKLAEERKRLAAQGLSEAEIKKRLDDFERQKSAEYNTQLEAYRVQAEATRKKNEADLKAREDQFNQSLSQVNQEKEKIAAEAKKREDELRRQLETQSAQSAAQATAQAKQGQAALDAASAQISRLAQARDQEKQIGNQIAGFYATARDQLRDRKTEQAAETLRLLREYLNSDQVTGLESLKQRRESDLFMVDALGGYIERERKAGETVAGSVQSATESLKAQEASAAALKDAQARYETQLAKLQQESEAAQKKLQDLLAAQEKAAREQAGAADRAAKDAALARDKSIAEKDRQITDRDRLLAERDKALAEKEKTAADLASAGEALVRKLAGLDGDLAALRLNNDGLARTIADLEKTVETQRAEISRQKTVIDSVTGSQSDLGERIRTMEGQVADLKTANQTAGDRLTATAKELDRTKADLDAAVRDRDLALADGKEKDARLAGYAGDLVKLTVIANTYSGMVQSWSAYVQADRELRAKQQASATGEDARNRETKVLLDSFVSSESMRKAFPDLLERIKAYDKAFEAAGKQNVTLDLADQVYAVASFEGRQQRLDYLKLQIQKAADSGRKEFWQNLHKLLSTQPGE